MSNVQRLHKVTSRGRSSVNFAKYDGHGIRFARRRANRDERHVMRTVLKGYTNR